LCGPVDLVERPHNHLAAAPVTRAIHPDRPGIVGAIDTRAVGLAVVALGGGRTRAEDRIDHAVGLTDLAELGSEVGPDRPLAMLHARDDAAAATAEADLRQAYSIIETGAPLLLASPLLARITA
jgi:thymidine phosphorylase